MIPQGFPLFAVDIDDRIHAIVGWREEGATLLPVGVPLAAEHGIAAALDSRGVAMFEDFAAAERYTQL